MTHHIGPEIGVLPTSNDAAAWRATRWAYDMPRLQQNDACGHKRDPADVIAATDPAPGTIACNVVTGRKVPGLVIRGQLPAEVRPEHLQPAAHHALRISSARIRDLMCNAHGAWRWIAAYADARSTEWDVGTAWQVRAAPSLLCSLTPDLTRGSRLCCVPARHVVHSGVVIETLAALRFTAWKHESCTALSVPLCGEQPTRRCDVGRARSSGARNRDETLSEKLDYKTLCIC